LHKLDDRIRLAILALPVKTLHASIFATHAAATNFFYIYFSGNANKPKKFL